MKRSSNSVHMHGGGRHKRFQKVSAMHLPPPTHSVSQPFPRQQYQSSRQQMFPGAGTQRTMDMMMKFNKFKATPSQYCFNQESTPSASQLYVSQTVWNFNVPPPALGTIPPLSRPPQFAPQFPPALPTTAIKNTASTRTLPIIDTSVPPPPLPPPYMQQFDESMHFDEQMQYDEQMQFEEHMQFEEQMQYDEPTPGPFRFGGGRGNAFPSPASTLTDGRGSSLSNQYDDDLILAATQTVVNKKPKRKSMSNRYGYPKDWAREDALKAISLENEYSKRNVRAPVLILRFPDPELDREVICNFTKDIETVHFQQNIAPRYCFVHLKEGSDVKENIAEISKIPFGTGFMTAELKRPHASTAPPSKPEEVDPYTLYIGNLSPTVSCTTVREHFPLAQRIDIGYAQRMKYTRYAFVRYATVEEALEAYKTAFNTLIESRSLIVRFRRQRCSIASGTPVTRRLTTNGAVEVSEENATIEANAMALVTAKSSAATEVPETTAEAAPETLETSNDEGDITRLGSSTPSSMEEPETLEVMVDTKDNVMEEAKLLLQQQKAQIADRARQPKEKPTGAMMLRRSSLEDMFDELERGSSNSARLSTNSARLSTSSTGLSSNTLSIVTTTAVVAVPNCVPIVQIKEEKDVTEDNLSEEEEDPPSSILGSRYNEKISGEVKDEPVDEPVKRIANKTRPNIEYDEDFDSEPEDAPNLVSTSTKKTVQKTKLSSAAILRQYDEDLYSEPEEAPNLPSASIKKTAPTSAEIIRQQELAITEKKPDINALAAIGSASTEVGTMQASPYEKQHFIEKLYDKMRRYKESNTEGKRPPDELDDMFERMNSDNDDDDSF